MSRDTDTDWNRVAETDPYWGVISAEKFRGSVMEADALTEFMAGGESYVNNLFALIRKQIDPNFAPAKVLDFGCGVGRLVLPFARRASEVVGVDIAPAMLDRCQQHAQEAGLANVKLRLSSDTLADVGEGFDLVNTFIVLQHIPVERGYRFIRRLAALLAVGGVGSLQVTYAKSRKFLIHEGPKAEFYRREGNTLVDLVESDWQPPPGTITMFDYDLNAVIAEISRCTNRPLTVLPSNHDGHLGAQILFVKTHAAQ